MRYELLKHLYMMEYTFNLMLICDKVNNIIFRDFVLYSITTLQTMSRKCFVLLTNVDVMESKPDIVEEYFEYCGR